MGKYKKWNCVLCGDTLVEGQRFAYIPGKGYAHIECFYEKLAKTRALDRDTVALMDANEVLLYTIVRLKEAARIAGSNETRELLTRARKSIEDYAEELEKILSSKLT